MYYVIQMMYTLTIFVMVSACTVNLTVRFKNLTALSSIAKQESTSYALVLVLVFNLIDYLIIYLSNMGFSKAITAMYVIENLLEIALVYVVMRMGSDYENKTYPNWINSVFIFLGVLALSGDGVYTIWPGVAGDMAYAIYMTVINAIPITILMFYAFRFWRGNSGAWKLNFAETYILLYSVFCIILSVVITLNTIDSRTAYNFFTYDAEIYLIIWLTFNIYNFIFVWKTLSVDERPEVARILTPEEKIQFISKQFGLSQRESEIASLLYEGKNNKEIAATMFLSLNTIKVHASNLYKKLGVSNRIQAVQIIRGDNLPIGEDEIDGNENL